MRFKHTGGAAVLLFALSLLAGSGVVGHAGCVRSELTMSALTSTAVPGVNSSMSAADDYLSSVCQQGEYQWEPDKLPVKVYISNGAGTAGYRPVFNTFVRQAFGKWCDASGNKLTWKEVKDPSQANVNVTWTTNVTQRSNGTEAGETNAYARLDHASGRGIIYGARMQLLTELPARQFSDEEMDKTILHETGHALGLQGHSPVPTDIMYYSINAQQTPELTARDEATMQHLYADYPNNVPVIASTKK